MIYVLVDLLDRELATFKDLEKAFDASEDMAGYIIPMTKEEYTQWQITSL